MELLQIDRLTFRYPGAAQAALQNVSLTLRHGEFAVLCGPSGSGKSTLLRLLKPQLRPHGERSGALLWQGEPTDTLPLRAASADIGFVSQDPQSQLVSDKVLHELAFGAESLGLAQEEIARRVAETATYFGIGDWLHRDITSLSGGQQQLLVLAAVMLTRPKLLLLDEPTARLDPHTAETFLQWLQTIRRDFGTAILLCEQRLEAVLPQADRVFVLQNGALCAAGTPQEALQALCAADDPFFFAMPAAARIRRGLGGDGAFPCTVAEGRAMLSRYLETHPAQPLSAPQPLPQGAPALELTDVSFRYEKTAPDVLRDLSLTANRGELLCLLGANGSGKTTLLRAAAGVLRVQYGAVAAHGKTALLPQQPQDLFWHETVREELQSVCSDGSRIGELLSRFRLQGLEERHPADLSGGEQQKLALSKLLLTDPDVLLLDEPTKGLDAPQKAALAGVLRRCCRRGMCVIAVSHDVAFCAAAADRCALLFDGGVQPAQPPGTFFSQNGLYTTAAARIAQDLLPGCVTVNDVLRACGKPPETLPELPPEPPAAPQPAPASAAGGTLPLWRKIGAGCSLLGAAVSFALAARELGGSALSDLARGGSVSGAGWAFCGAFAGWLLLLLLFLNRPDAAAAALPRAPRGETVFAAVWLLLVLPALLVLGLHVFGQKQYYLLSLLLLLLGLLPFFVRFERRRPSARGIAVLAALCALAVAGRAAFFMLPQFKPVLAVVILAGAALGAESGFVVGAVTMLLSNLLFSQGPWTPFQMFAMGAVGALAGVLVRFGVLPPRRLPLCVFGAVSAVVIYGGIMNPAAALLWGGEALNRAVLLSYYATGLPMDLIHAAATALFLWALAPTILTQLSRLQTKYGALT